MLWVGLRRSEESEEESRRRGLQKVAVEIITDNQCDAFAY